MLKEAVLLLFAFRQQSESEVEPNVLSRIAATHQRIPPHIYDFFVDALIHTVCCNAQAELPAFDPECFGNAAQAELVEDHWRISVEPAISYMKRRASMPLAAAA